MSQRSSCRSVRAQALVLAIASFVLLNGATCNLVDLLNITGDDQAAACRQVSPGGEIAIGAAMRARIVKATFDFTQCTLTRSDGNETLFLIAKDPNAGFDEGETAAEIRVSFTHNGGPIVPGTYIDLTASSQQTNSFQVSATSMPNTNALPLFNGTGSATVTDFKLTGNKVTFKATFTLKMFEVYTATVQDFCGEVNFDGPVTISG